VWSELEKPRDILESMMTSGRRCAQLSSRRRASFFKEPNFATISHRALRGGGRCDPTRNRAKRLLFCATYSNSTGLSRFIRTVPLHRDPLSSTRCPSRKPIKAREFNDLIESRYDRNLHTSSFLQVLFFDVPSQKSEVVQSRTTIIGQGAPRACPVTTPTLVNHHAPNHSHSIRKW
jgi:hypothetical protein